MAFCGTIDTVLAQHGGAFLAHQAANRPAHIVDCWFLCVTFVGVSAQWQSLQRLQLLSLMQLQLLCAPCLHPCHHPNSFSLQ
jgi:hypothetical protein